MRKEPRSVQLHFVVSEPEAELIKERMAELGITKMTRLLRICSNNLNQYAKRAHESGNVYAADIDDLRTRLDELWEAADGLLRGFANIP